MTTDVRHAIGENTFGLPMDKVQEALLKLAKMGPSFSKIGYLSKNLGTNDWFVGGEVTLADIFVATVVTKLDVVLRSAGVENGIPFTHSNLRAHRDRVFALPGIKERVTKQAWKDQLWMGQVYIPFTLLTDN